MSCSCNCGSPGCSSCNACPPCDPSIPETCEALEVTTEATGVVVEDSAFCKRTLEDSENPSVLYDDGEGGVTWRDGSVASPLCLPDIQSQVAGTTKGIIAADTNGCLRKWNPTNNSTEYVPVGTGADVEWKDKSDVYGDGCGALVKDCAGDDAGEANWQTGTEGQVLTIDEDGNARFSSLTLFPEVAAGRLTLSSLVPVTVNDVLASGVIYYTPYKGNNISLYDGTGWVMQSFSEISLSIAGLSADMNYDVFVYNNAGTLTLETQVWLNATARSVALVLQDGIWVKTGATTRRYVGSIRITGVAGQCEDSTVKRFCWNANNRVFRPVVRSETDDVWTYNTDAWRQANANTANQIAAIFGLSDSNIELQVHSTVDNDTEEGPTSPYITNGIGVDSTTVNSALITIRAESQASQREMPTTAIYYANPAIGYHYYPWLERSDPEGVTSFFGTTSTNKSGLVGRLDS